MSEAPLTVLPRARTYRQPLLLGTHQPERLGLRAVPHRALQQLFQRLAMRSSAQRSKGIPTRIRFRATRRVMLSGLIPYRVPWFFSRNAARSQIVCLDGNTCSAWA